MDDRHPPARSSAWPFLVGSGKMAPQQVIMAPEFMIVRQITALLLHATGSADVVRTESQSSTAWRCQIRNGQVDEFSIVFRVTRAGPELVGASGDILLDDTSRPVYLAEGVVVIGAPTDITDAVFRQVHAITTSAFRDFWAAGTRHGTPVVSEPLPEQAASSGATSLVITDLSAITYSSPVTLGAQPPANPAESPTATGEAAGPAPRIITIGPWKIAALAVLIAAGIALLVYFLAS